MTYSVYHPDPGYSQGKISLFFNPNDMINLKM